MRLPEQKTRKREAAYIIFKNTLVCMADWSRRLYLGMWRISFTFPVKSLQTTNCSSAKKLTDFDHWENVCFYYRICSKRQEFGQGYKDSATTWSQSSAKPPRAKSVLFMHYVLLLTLDLAHCPGLSGLPPPRAPRELLKGEKAACPTTPLSWLPV